MSIGAVKELRNKLKKKLEGLEQSSKYINDELRTTKDHYNALDKAIEDESIQDPRPGQLTEISKEELARRIGTAGQTLNG